MAKHTSVVGTVSIGDVNCIMESVKAIQVIIYGERKWIPKSVIHDDSEVYKDGDSGTLVLKEWFAEKEGLS